MGIKIVPRGIGSLGLETLTSLSEVEVEKLSKASFLS